MKHITVTVDDEVYRRAAIQAAKLNTSVVAMIEEFLLQLTGGKPDFERRKRLQRETIFSIGAFSAGDRLCRDEIHDRGALA